VNEAPKILWYDDQDCSAGPVQFGDSEVKYVRSDLVEGLVEVVEKLAKWNKDYPSTRVYGYGDIKQIAEEMDAINAQAIAALAKANW
jgi:hypothetical protein